MEADILLWIQDVVRNPVLTPIMKGITTLGNAGMIWIVLGIILLIIPKTRKIGGGVLLALFASFIINNGILKNLVNRTRPYEVIAGLEILIGKQVDSSFPSGHTGSSFAAATVLYLTLPKKFGIPALIFAALMGFSRLYVGVHYPTDVLAGMVIGILIGWAVVHFTGIREKNVKK